MLANVTKEERDIIRAYVENGRGGEMLPCPFMGWAPMVALTAWQWLFKNPLDNVHSDAGGDFSEVARIRQSGALIIGTYDRFSYGEPRAFIELINAHTRAPEKNEVIFVEGTGHVYSQREQMLADIVLRLARKWQAEGQPARQKGSPRAGRTHPDTAALRPACPCAGASQPGRRPGLLKSVFAAGLIRPGRRAGAGWSWPLQISAGLSACRPRG